MNNKDKLKILDEPFVAIVVLVWNNYKDSRKCIESCYSLTYKNLLLILVDNGSSDGSGRQLSKEFPDVDFIYNDENLGYAGGNNVGIRRALERGAEYVLIVNNDIEISTTDIIEKMVYCFHKIPRLGILGPKIISTSQVETNNKPEPKSGVYNYINKHFLRKSSFCPPSDFGLIAYDRVVVSGCVLMLSRHILKKIGYFNEDFFMYGEEDDLCLRAVKEGYLVICIDDSRVSVIRNGDTFHSDLIPWKAFIMARNRFIQLRPFPFSVQCIIVILHIVSLSKTTVKRVLKRKWKNILYSFLGLMTGFSIWVKDLLRLSVPGEYLVSGRRVAQEGVSLNTLLKKGL
jgi:hypothetical protein